jgi:hypothetical protein
MMLFDVMVVTKILYEPELFLLTLNMHPTSSDLMFGQGSEIKTSQLRELHFDVYLDNLNIE